MNCLWKRAITVLELIIGMIVCSIITIGIVTFIVIVILKAFGVIE